MEARKNETIGYPIDASPHPMGDGSKVLLSLWWCCYVPNKPEAMLRIDDLLIPLTKPSGWQQNGATPHRVGGLNLGLKTPGIFVGFVGLNGGRRGVGNYCNQPRLRKYHMGTMALASINARA